MSTALSKNRHCEVKCILENYRQKVDIELDSNFQPIHRYFFSKVCYQIILYLLLFSGKNLECFKVQFSVAVFVHILSSKGANQLQLLYIRTLGNIQGKLSTEAALLKCIPSDFFPEICTSFRTTCKKHPLENYILAYHRADKDHAEIF